MDELVIGCPVAHREWILDRWFDHVEAACDVAGVKPRYVFAVDLDDASWPIIAERAGNVTVLPVPNAKGDDTRVWHERRYRYMVDLRNLILRAVRELEPDAFLSLDSDILIHPQHIESMIEGLSRFTAVGGKCYMTPGGTKSPSWGRIGRDGGLQRIEAQGLFAVDVIMAIKLMSPAAYAIDYAIDLQGEDLGWSRHARRSGVHLGWDGRYCSKHVMRPDLLDPVDDRVGY